MTKAIFAIHKTGYNIFGRVRSAKREYKYQMSNPNAPAIRIEDMILIEFVNFCFNLSTL